jgi:putative zinc finger/helix-turn-helix YgiT family protein
MPKTSKTKPLGDCAVCGRVTRLAVISEWTIPASSTKPAVIVHNVECQECAECSERYLEPEQIRLFERKVIEAQRVAKNLLSAAEIRQVREQLGINKERLEKILNLNPKSFYRWENGLSIQSDVVDTVLRLLRKYPDAVHTLAEERGVPLTVQKGRPRKAG